MHYHNQRYFLVTGVGGGNIGDPAAQFTVDHFFVDGEAGLSKVLGEGDAAAFLHGHEALGGAQEFLIQCGRSLGVVGYPNDSVGVGGLIFASIHFLGLVGSNVVSFRIGFCRVHKQYGGIYGLSLNGHFFHAYRAVTGEGIYQLFADFVQSACGNRSGIYRADAAEFGGIFSTEQQCGGAALTITHQGGVRLVHRECGGVLHTLGTHRHVELAQELALIASSLAHAEIPASAVGRSEECQSDLILICHCTPGQTSFALGKFGGGGVVRSEYDGGRSPGLQTFGQIIGCVMGLFPYSNGHLIQTAHNTVIGVLCVKIVVLQSGNFLEHSGQIGTDRRGVGILAGFLQTLGA